MYIFYDNLDMKYIIIFNKKNIWLTYNLININVYNGVFNFKIYFKIFLC